jgi:signal transduction histidine kinase
VTDTRSPEQPEHVVDHLRAEVAELRASRRRVAEASDAELQAIEREIHDGLQQDLVALALNLRRLGGLVATDASAAGGLTAELLSTVREAIEEAARLAARTYPAMLDGRGLTGALRSAAGTAGVAAIVNTGAVADLSPLIAAAIYRTWADALAVAQPGSDATIDVDEADGGLAFAVNIAARDAALPLDRLRDRIEALDGRLSAVLGQERARIQGWLPLA